MALLAAFYSGKKAKDLEKEYTDYNPIEGVVVDVTKKAINVSCNKGRRRPGQRPGRGARRGHRRKSPNETVRDFLHHVHRDSPAKSLGIFYHNPPKMPTPSN